MRKFACNSKQSYLFIEIKSCLDAKYQGREDWHNILRDTTCTEAVHRTIFTGIRVFPVTECLPRTRS